MNIVKFRDKNYMILFLIFNIFFYFDGYVTTKLGHILKKFKFYRLVFSKLTTFLCQLSFNISNANSSLKVCLIITRRYGPLCRPTFSSCGGLLPSAEAFFCPKGQKNAYYTVLDHFWQFLVSSSNLCNF